MEDCVRTVTFRVKRVRFASRDISFILYNNNKESFFSTIVNILSLRKRIQLPNGINDISSEKLRDLLAPLFRKIYADRLNTAFNTLLDGVAVKCPLSSVNPVLDDEITEVLSLLSIQAFHGSLAGQRYKKVEKHDLEDLERYIELIEQKEPVEGLRLVEEEAATASAFLKKYNYGITEKGFKALKEQFKASDTVIHSLYCHDRFHVLICKDDTLYTLMADAGYEQHNCVWQRVDQPEFYDERFNKYDKDISHLRADIPAFLPDVLHEDVKVASRYDPAIAAPKVQQITAKITIKGPSSAGDTYCASSSGGSPADAGRYSSANRRRRSSMKADGSDPSSERAEQRQNNDSCNEETNKTSDLYDEATSTTKKRGVLCRIKRFFSYFIKNNQQKGHRSDSEGSSVS